jgi:hypothetical protein
MPKGSKKPCKGSMYVVSGKKWCVGEKLVKKSKKSVAHKSRRKSRRH